jgi:hypothetical protein
MTGIELEIERAIVPAFPQMLAALVDLAANARNQRIRARAGRRLRCLIMALSLDAERPNTFRGAWARRALVENTSAVTAYLTACIKKKEAKRAKPNRAGSR